jgi:uncharacterized protein (DUF952 family)
LARVYKILSRAEWEAARRAGHFAGSAADHADGFIHLSTAAQAQRTAELHFAGQTDLMLLEIEADRLGVALKWAPSRGGDLFPHLHGVLDCGLVELAQPVALDDDGVPQLGQLRP